MHLKDWLQAARRRLQPYSDTPGLDAQSLLAHHLDRPRTWVLAHPEVELQPRQLDRLEAGLQALEAGQPLPYLLGHREFYGLDFLVTPATLIPRPETELLVETALAEISSARELWVADVGTGSGCIAVSLAVHAPRARLVACDLSQAALQVAGANARRHAVGERVWLVQADLLPPVGPPFDLVCANLPYIPSDEMERLAVSRVEPRLALDGGPDGLSAIRRLLRQCRGRVAPGARLLLEIEAGQGAAALALGQAAFPQARAAVKPDLAGRDRLLVVETLNKV
jgi:release factor glutamine methyltransferase